MASCLCLELCEARGVRAPRCPQPYTEHDHAQARKGFWWWRSHSANPSSLSSCPMVPAAEGDSRDWIGPSARSHPALHARVPTGITSSTSQTHPCAINPPSPRPRRSGSGTEDPRGRLNPLLPQGTATAAGLGAAPRRCLRRGGTAGAPSLFVVSAEKSALSGHESSDLFSHLRER